MKHLKLAILLLLVVAVLGGCTVSGSISVGTRATVMGRITDSDGYPLGGVTVRIAGHGYDITGSDGRYWIPSVPVGEHTMELSKSPWKTQRLDVFVRSSGSIDVTYTYYGVFRI